MNAKVEGAQYLYTMIVKFWLQPTLAVAVQLKLPDLVADGPKSAEQLAAATSTQVGALRRVLNALASEGIFQRGEDDRFGPTAMSEMLCDAHPSALGHLLNTSAYGENLAAWGELEASIRTGKSAFEIQHGTSPWEYIQDRPDRREVFAKAMTAMTRANEVAVLEAHDFGEFSLAVDVGGNQASLIGRVLEQNPAARGIVFDLPGTVEAGHAAWKDKPIAARLTAVGGDFFHEVPQGDLYLLKSVLHDWSDEDSIKILKAVRRSILPGGRVAIIEAVLPETAVPHLGWGLDMAMMAATGGKERTLSEFDRILDGANFKRLSCTSTPSIYSVVEATAV